MLFTFPSRYWYAIGLTGVFSLTGWSRRIRAGFLVSRVTQDNATSWSYYPAGALPHMRFGLFPVRSPLLGESLLFSLPAGTKMFQFPALASSTWSRMYVLHTYRLSHSEIPGSRVICTYPGLIAAYHVLHRLCEPRHPPCALFYFVLYNGLR